MKKINIYDDCDEIFDELYDRFDLMPAEVIQGLLDDCLDDWLRANYGRGLNESVRKSRRGRKAYLESLEEDGTFDVESMARAIANKLLENAVLQFKAHRAIIIYLGTETLNKVGIVIARMELHKLHLLFLLL